MPPSRRVGELRLPAIVATDRRVGEPVDSYHRSCLHRLMPRRTPSQPPGSASAVDPRTVARRDARIARALRAVGAALGPSEDLDTVLELVLDKTQELLESERATLYLLDETTGELVSRVVGGDQVRSVRMRVGFGIAGIAAQTGRTLRIRDAYSDPRFEQEWDLLTGFRTRNMLATPLRNHVGATIGVLQVLNKQGADEFTQDDEELLAALSTQAAVAIDNSRLVLRLKEKNRQLLDTQQALERRVRELQLLFELERSTARAHTLDDLAAAALEHVVPASDSRGGALLVSEPESGNLMLYCFEPGIEKRASQRVKGLDGLMVRVMREAEERNLDEAALGNEKLEAVFSFRPRTGALCSLDGDDGPLGVFGLFDKQGHASFDDSDMELLRLVSANVSTALRLHYAASERERSERLTTIGGLLSQVIHDFKTPMTVISGYSQLMVDSEDRGQRAEYAEEIVRQFEVVTAMQREVLEFARGERSMFVRRVHLGYFFDDLRRQVQRELEGTSIELQMNIDRKSVARFDEGRMARALHNLVRNAIEAIGDNPGRLSIAARREGDVLIIEVSDSGPGVPEHIQGTLFQSFVTANKRGGTGLGLAIVKKIVEEHGGTIEVESSSKGARFRLRIPELPDSAPPRSSHAGTSAHPQSGPASNAPSRMTR